MLTRHVHLDREPEQQLREVVVKERRDLQSLVLPLFRHPVRQRAKDVFAILQLLVSFLERLASEEHLPSKEQRKHDYRHGPEAHIGHVENPSQNHPKDREPQVANDELTQAPHAQLADDAHWTHPEMNAGRKTDE